MEIGLVSCTKSKRDSAAQPRDLYDESPLFRKERTYVEANHDDWYILSAKHHLLDPTGPKIEPYDETLTGAPVARRREWALAVRDELEAEGLLEEDTTLVFHTGKDYYGELLPLLEESPMEVKLPTEGLQIGEKLSWYNERI